VTAIMIAMLASVTAQAALAVTLPGPRRDSGYSIERALSERRTVREFSAAVLPLADLAQLAWAAQGVLAPSGRRTTPSAGALYPLEVYILAANVQDLAPGVYRYQPALHRLAAVAEGDRRKTLAEAAWGQRWMEQAPAILVIAAVERRTTAKYGQRGVRYGHMEAGHAAQNALLQAVALDLDVALVGAFTDADVQAALGLPRDARPLYLIPVGRPR
jgi:SagB-type dehydrogenase family enzyme